ncbi:MAG: hypothetical protein ABIB79_03920 [archaeon]
MVKVTLHNHFRTRSNFKPEDFNRIVDLAYEGLGRGAIVGITNFTSGENAFNYERVTGFRGYKRDYIGGEKGNAIFVPEKEITLIKTQEIPTKQGHVLVPGGERGKNLKPDKNLEYTLKEAEEINSKTFLVHLYSGSGVFHYIKDNMHWLNYVGGIEIQNGEAVLSRIGVTPIDANRKSREFYREAVKKYPHLIPLVSSDGHSFYEFRENWVEISDIDRSSPEKLIESLMINLRTPSRFQTHNAPLRAAMHIVEIEATVALAKVGLYDSETGKVK